KSVVLSPGASPGQVTINGDLKLDGNDTLAIEINGTGPTAYDSFSVTGLTTLGNSTLALSGPYAPAAVDSFAVISGGTVTGAFNSPPTPFNLRPISVNVSGTNVTVAGTSSSTIAGTAGADTFSAQVVGANIQIFKNGVLVLDTPIAGLTSITIDA